MVRSCWFLVVALFLGVVHVPAAAALDAKDAVQSGVTPSKWAKDVESGNKDKWKVVDKVSAGMAQILQVATYALGDQSPKDRCKLAAVNLAFSVVADAYGTAGFNDLAEGLKGAAKDILSLGDNTVIDLVKDKIKDAGKDAAKEFIKGLLKKEKPEVYKKATTKSGCDIVLLAIWDKAAGTYEVVIYGHCNCTPQPTGTIQGSIQLGAFAVRLQGSVQIDVDSTEAVPLLRPGYPTKTEIEANCQICVKPATTAKTTTTATPPAASTPVPTPPKTVDLDKLCERKPPCKECLATHEKIVAICKRNTEIDGELRDLAGQLGGNGNRQQSLKDEIAGQEKASTLSVDALLALAKLRDKLIAEQKEAKEIQEKASKLGLEQQGLKSQAGQLATQLDECVKTQCGPGHSQVPGKCPSGGGALAGALNSIFDSDIQPACEDVSQQGARGQHRQENDK